jgi:two-component system NtrC family sensor kinase
MSIYSLPCLLGAIASLILGFTVYWEKRESPSNRVFLLLSLSFVVWNFGVFLLYLNLPVVKALLIAKIVHIAILWAPVFFLNLIFFFLEIKTRFFLPAIHVITAFLSILTLSGLIIRGVFKISYTPNVSAFFAQAGSLYPLFIIYMLSIVLFAIWNLWKILKQSTGLKKTQAKYLLSGFIFATIGFNDMLPIIGIVKYPLTNVQVYTFGSISIIFWDFLIAYAIVKHHLMDIDIIIRKGAVYAYLAFAVFVPCMLILFFAQKFFFGLTNPFFTFLTFCTLLLACLAILKVGPEIETYIEKRLFKSKFEYKKALRELSEIIVSFLDEKDLFKKTGDILTKDLGAEKLSFFILDKEKHAYTLRASHNLQKSHIIRELSQHDPFFKWLKSEGKAVVKEELEQSRDLPGIKPIISRLASLESEVCIPLLARDHVIGIINLGSKRSGAMYSHEDLELLTHFAAQASVALENARLYQEMSMTQQLMRRSDRMASLGSLTAGLAHEIRNPLVTIKTFLDLMPERYQDQEFRGDFLKLTASEVERINNLITGLLDFARPVKPLTKNADINAVIKEIIPLIAVELRKKNISLDMKLQEDVTAWFDADQIKQVILNLLLNAIDAIAQNGTISVTTRQIQRHGKRYAQIEVTDTGQGIPKKILENIFDPFFTTKERGVGLGLSICHQIIEDHHGTIEVESRPKNGTSFYVNIPHEK